MPNATATNRSEFERHLDGMVFGDSREEGMVRGNEFVHPVLRFALRFPQGWEIMNTDQQVSARQDANSNVAGDQAFSFIGTGAFTNVAGQLRYDVDSVHNVLVVMGDVNGDGAADFTFDVHNAPALLASDFYL